MVAVEPIDWSKGTAATQIFDGLKKNMAPNLDHTSPVDFLMVAGDGRDDEVIFRWANDLGKDGTVDHVTTVSLGSRNTEAGCTLTQGVTGRSTYSFLYIPLTNIRRLNGPTKARNALVDRHIRILSGFSRPFHVLRKDRCHLLLGCRATLLCDTIGYVIFFSCRQ